MEFQDRLLSCADCGQEFTFTAGEQEFYERKGFKEVPKRCRPCREARKTRRTQSSPGTLPGNVREPGFQREAGQREPAATREPSVREYSPQEADGNRAPRAQRELFEATCARCGQMARVPFRPAAGRPVYCRDCYTSKSRSSDPNSD